MVYLTITYPNLLKTYIYIYKLVFDNHDDLPKESKSHVHPKTLISW